jgi:hypothetical protein
MKDRSAVNEPASELSEKVKRAELTSQLSEGVKGAK